ncbi:MAG: hypothetical protein M3342_01850, partial [Bacteroidota bacterium]|nr:hypothetical protein [Bacteroidota bacterium]
NEATLPLRNGFNCTCWPDATVRMDELKVMTGRGLTTTYWMYQSPDRRRIRWQSTAYFITICQT